MASASVSAPGCGCCPSSLETPLLFGAAACSCWRACALAASSAGSPQVMPPAKGAAQAQAAQESVRVSLTENDVFSSLGLSYTLM